VRDVFEYLQVSPNKTGPYKPADISGYMAKLIEQLESMRNSAEDVAKVRRWKKQFDGYVQANHIQSVPLAELKGNRLLFQLNSLCATWKGKWAREEALRNRFKGALVRFHTEGRAAEYVSRKISLAEYHALQVNSAMTNDHRYCMDKYKWVHNEGVEPNQRTLTGPTHYAIWRVKGGTLDALGYIAVDEDDGGRPEGGLDAPVLIKSSCEPGAYGVHEALLPLFNELCIESMVASGELDPKHNIPPRPARPAGRRRGARRGGG
jgi:hypothetical protein